MNIKNFTHILISIFAVLLLASCGGDPNIESAKLNLANNDFDGVITAAQAALQENPENALAYYYIGVAHLGKSELKPLSDQEEDLVNARNSLNRSKELFRAQQSTAEEAELARVLLVSRWQNFYVDAVDPINFDGENDPQLLQDAVYGLNNAIAIAPDTLLNYDALSQIYFLMGDYDNAIDKIRYAIDNSPEPDLQRYQTIVFYYSQKGDEDGVLEVLQDARSRFPSEVYFAQEVANIYIRRGESETAIAVLMELVDIDPDNAEYRYVIGSQIYRDYLALNTQVGEKYEEIYEINDLFRDEARKARPDNRKLREYDERIAAITASIISMNEEMFEIAKRAEEQLLLSYEIDQNSANTTYLLGVVYENLGMAISAQRNLTDDINKANALEAEAKEYFKKSVPFYLQTTELEEDPENWFRLFQVYTRLQME